MSSKRREHNLNIGYELVNRYMSLKSHSFHRNTFLSVGKNPREAVFILQKHSWVRREQMWSSNKTVYSFITKNLHGMLSKRKQTTSQLTHNNLLFVFNNFIRSTSLLVICIHMLVTFFFCCDHDQGPIERVCMTLWFQSKETESQSQQ